jgi:hypothetical protein
MTDIAEYRRVASPMVSGLAAFQGDSFLHTASKISQLLCIATYLRGDAGQIASIQSMSSDLGAPRPRKATMTSLSCSLDRLTELALAPGAFAVAGKQFSLDGAEHEIADTPETRLWRNIRQYRSSMAAFALLNLSLDDDLEIVRVAAASALVNLHPQSSARVHEILRLAINSTNDLAVEMAAAALGDSIPATHAPEWPLTGAYARKLLGAVSLLVHGTFARLGEPKNKWNEPGDPLAVHIKTMASPELHLGDDYFRWSGGYGDDARRSGAQDLFEWCRKRGLTELDTVYAHGHGGNVVLDAIASGLRVRLLVLLHVPILLNDLSYWATIESRVGRIVDLRTDLDWVVLLDGLRTQSRNGFTNELTNVRRLNPAAPAHARVSHSRYVTDSVWKSLDLAIEVKSERSLV